MDDPAFDGWRALACAVLIRAYRDARKAQGDLAAEARDFLASEGGQVLMDLLGLNPDLLAAVLAEPARSGDDLTTE